MTRRRFPSSLGEHVAGWIEARCCHGPGDVYGDPVRLTGEEVAFLEEAYRIDPVTGRRETDLAVYSRRKGTRKSELGAWLVAAECDGPTRAYLDGNDPVARPPRDPAVICAATTEDQGDLVYGAFRAIVKASPSLEQLFDVGLEVTYLVGRPGKVELVQSRNAAALDGARPTFEVADESHLWGPLLHETYATLRRNLRKRHAAQPWLFLPTTAYQPDEESVAELLHKAVGFHEVGRRRAGRLLHDHRQAATRWNLASAEEVRFAVEEAGGDAFWSDTDAICAELEAGTPEWEFRRYWLNQPIKADEATWLPAGAFNLCREEGVALAAGAETVVMVDSAIRHDSVAVVAVQRRSDDSRVLAEAWTLRGNDDDLYDAEETERYIRRLAGWVDLVEVRFDPAYFVRSAQVLADEGLPMVEMPQSPQRMVPACGLAYQMIVGQELVHDFDDEATRQIEAGVPRAAGEGWRLSKGKSAGKIDTAIALAGAVDGLVAWENRDMTAPEIW